MFDTIYNFILENYKSSFSIGFCVYWVPVGICLLHGIWKTITNSIADMRLNNLSDDEYRRTSESYSHDNIGNILGRIIISAIPIVNIFKTLSLFPDIFSFVLSNIEKFISIELIKPKIRNYNK